MMETTVKDMITNQYRVMQIVALVSFIEDA